MSTIASIAKECERRDAAKVPVPQFVRELGYATWTEWADAMTRPNPLLMGLKFVTLEQSAADEGRTTYRYERPRREGK